MAPIPAAASLTGGDTTTSPQLNVQLPRLDNWWETRQPSSDSDIVTSYDDDGYAAPTTAATETYVTGEPSHGLDTARGGGTGTDHLASSSLSTHSPISAVNTSSHHLAHRTISDKQSTTDTSPGQITVTVTKRRSRVHHVSSHTSTIASVAGSMPTVTYNDNTEIVLPTSTYRHSESAIPAPTSTDPYAGYTYSSTSGDWYDTTTAVDGGYGSNTQISTTTKKSKTTRSSSASSGHGDTLSASETSSDSLISTKTSASKTVKISQVVQSMASSLYASDNESAIKTTDGTVLFPASTSSITSTGIHPSTAYQAVATDKSFFDNKGKVAGVFATVGIILLAALMGFLILCFRRKRSNARRSKRANKVLLADHEKDQGSAGSSGTGLNEMQPTIERVESRQSIPPIPPILPFQYYATQPTIEDTLAPVDTDFANRISNDSAYSQDGKLQTDLERGNITPPEIGRTGRRWTPADRINWGAAAHFREASMEQGGNSEQGGIQSTEHTTDANSSNVNNHNEITRASPSHNSTGSAVSRGCVVYSGRASGNNTPIASPPLTPAPTNWASRLRQRKASANSTRSVTSGSSFRTLIPPSRSPQNGASRENDYVIRQLPTAQELEEHMQPSRRTDMGSPKVQDPVREEGKRYSMGGRSVLESWENLQKFQESRRLRESVLRD